MPGEDQGVFAYGELASIPIMTIGHLNIVGRCFIAWFYPHRHVDEGSGRMGSITS
jgi:hypothetical protein